MSGSVCLHVYLRMSAAVSVYVSEETLGIDLCYYTVLCLVYTQCKSVYMNTHTHILKDMKAPELSVWWIKQASKQQNQRKKC